MDHINGFSTALLAKYKFPTITAQSPLELHYSNNLQVKPVILPVSPQLYSHPVVTISYLQLQSCTKIPSAQLLTSLSH